MDHVAIMNKKWALIEKILSGEKTIESRWYKTRRSPWNKIQMGDTVYFKNSGEPITVKANVSKVKQYWINPDPKVMETKHTLNITSIARPDWIYKRFGGKIGLERSEFKKSILKNNDKRYCILIWLTDPEEVDPFNIDKSGYGISSAWLCMDNINSIRI